MKVIEVRDQVSLPLRRCFQLCIHGIRYRLFRSAITVVIVSLAVAFLMMMLSTSYIDREVAADVQARTADRRVLEAWVGKLGVAMTSERLAETLADVQQGSPAWRELARWGGLGDEPLGRLRLLAQRQRQYQRYLMKLDPGQRSALVGARQGEAALAFLAEPGRIEEFFAKAKNFATPLPGEGGQVWVEQLVAEHAETAPQRKKVLAGHAAAVKALKAELKSRSVLELLAQADEKLPAALAGHGFLLGEADLEKLRAEAQIELDVERILALLRDGEMRSHIADRVGAEVRDVAPRHILKIASSGRGARWLTQRVDATRQNAIAKIQGLKESLNSLTGLLKLSPEQVSAICSTAAKEVEGGAASPSSEQARQLGRLVGNDLIRKAVSARLNVKLPLVKPTHVWQAASTVRGARWLIENMQMVRNDIPREIRDREQRLLEPLEMPPQRIVQVADTQVEQIDLSQVLAGLDVGSGEGWLGFSDRTVWLIIISFVVCVVGVANAMLMSVTERFREIATMKCLGALDSFIMIIFVMESSIQGLAGGVIGIFLGFLLGMIRSLWGFGALAVVNLPALVILASAGVCVVAGVVLAALAAVYPAWVAARLAPMEAMRIE